MECRESVLKCTGFADMVSLFRAMPLDGSTLAHEALTMARDLASNLAAL